MRTQDLFIVFSLAIPLKYGVFPERRKLEYLLGQNVFKLPENLSAMLDKPKI